MTRVSLLSVTSVGTLPHHVVSAASAGSGARSLIICSHPRDLSVRGAPVISTFNSGPGQVLKVLCDAFWLLICNLLA